MLRPREQGQSRPVPSPGGTRDHRCRQETVQFMTHGPRVFPKVGAGRTADYLTLTVTSWKTQVPKGGLAQVTQVTG